MQFSKFAPPIIYVSVPDAVITQATIADKNRHTALMTSLSELGVAAITFQHILAAAQIIIKATGQTMPFAELGTGQIPKNQSAAVNTAREEFARAILAKLSIKILDADVHYYFGQKDITKQTIPRFFSDSAHRQTWIKGINEYFSCVLRTQKFDCPIALLAVDPRRMTDDKLTPVIGLLIDDKLSTSQEVRLRKKVDGVISFADANRLAQKIAEVISYFTELRAQDASLRKELAGGHIKLEKQFDRDSWPGFELMNNVKQEVRRIVQEVVQERDVLCDMLDLEYQTLFRLTSLPIEEVFEDGAKLQAYLQDSNAYGYWRDILALDPKKVVNPVKLQVVRDIVEEQLLIIQERLENSALPLDTLLSRKGIFAEPDWKLQKYRGSIAAIKVQDGVVVESKKVAFKPVDIAYARELHSVLHYIHTPRAIKAFGLYLDGDDLPFSVVAFDAIDRPYKKDLLFMHGYDPGKCLDLARLYSRPGTPFNTSSTIFTLAFTHFKENEPEIQAILSAFMPTYAHGMSMVSAGFNYGVLVKEWRHSFAKRQINGKSTWELVTKRRKDDSQTTIDSKWPLLPVFELMATLRTPRFTPFSELDGMMISRNL